jgi:nucleotide-binding universal stress UspA family protein
MRILAAVDDSVFSEAAVRMVVRMVRPEGVQVCVLHASDSLVIVPEFTTPQGLDSLRAAEQQRLEEGKELVELTGQSLRAAGFQVETILKEADPRTGIIDHAAEWKADMIVVGSHGRKGLARLLIGSVAEFVARHAHCSVLVVRMSAAESA